MITDKGLCHMISSTRGMIGMITVRWLCHVIPVLSSCQSIMISVHLTTSLEVMNPTFRVPDKQATKYHENCRDDVSQISQISKNNQISRKSWTLCWGSWDVKWRGVKWRHAVWHNAAPRSLMIMTSCLISTFRLWDVWICIWRCSGEFLAKKTIRLSRKSN